MSDVTKLPTDNAREPTRKPAESSRTCRPGKIVFGKTAPVFLALAILLTSTIIAPASAREVTSLPWSAAPSTAIVTESKTFQSGDVELSGTLSLPRDGQALAAVVVTHTASKPLRDALLYQHLKEMLPPLGIAVLAYDRRGSGQSGGSLKDSDYAMLADDATAAVQMLKADARIDPKRIGIWGLSQGGWLALLAAANSSDVRFIVSISAPVVTPDVQMMFRSESSLRINGYSESDIAQMRATRQAVDDYMRGTGDRAEAQRLVDAAKSKPWFDLLYMGEKVGDRATSRWRREIEYDPLPTLDQVKVPALILFGANDPVVPVATSVRRINARLRPNMTMHVVADADHHMATSMSPTEQMDPALSNRVRPDTLEYFSVLASWMTAQDIAPSMGRPLSPARSSDEVSKAVCKPTALRVGRMRSFKPQSVRISRGHRRPRCQGSVRCSRASCGQVGAAQLGGSWSDDRSGPPWFDASNGCHSRIRPSRFPEPSGALFGRIASWTGAENYLIGSERRSHSYGARRPGSTPEAHPCSSQ